VLHPATFLRRVKFLESCVRFCIARVQERRMPTDTILIIRCAHCMAGIEFRPPAAVAENLNGEMKLVPA